MTQPVLINPGKPDEGNPAGEVARDRLSATIQFLGRILGAVIREQAGDAAFSLEERVRALAKRLRANGHTPNGEAPAKDQMREAVGALTVAQMRDLIKSFSEYFALVNLSEQLQRIWVLRDRALRHPDEPRSESIAAAVGELKRHGVNAATLEDWLASALVLPVFTAHPTEAKRRTTLDKLRRIGDAVQRATGEQLPLEAQATARLISEELVSLWQSDEV
ncbi:MAG TPA: phosphoenolpyruvate carboxylase, partial [Roseiflexaceae bacterium]|nr:phosphoenolpyruvate carboxylase [Roseiflexaceae bacterium]